MTSDTMASTVRTPGTGSVPGRKTPMRSGRMTNIPRRPQARDGAPPRHGMGPRPKTADASRRDDKHPPPAHECLGGGAVEHVGGPDEIGDEAVGRVLVDVAGIADLLDAPVIEHRQSV